MNRKPPRDVSFYQCMKKEKTTVINKAFHELKRSEETGILRSQKRELYCFFLHVHSTGYKIRIHEAAMKNFLVRQKHHAVAEAGLQRGQGAAPTGRELKGQQGQSGAWDQWERNLGVPHPAHLELRNWSNY